MASTLDIKHSIEADNVELFSLTGSLDTATHDQLEQAVKARIDEGARKVLLDLGGVDYMGSAGLRSFYEIQKNLMASEPVGDIKLANVSEKASRVLKTLGFDQFFSVYPDVQAGINAF